MTEDLSASSDYQWCVDEFSGVELHDARLNARCTELAVQLAAQPSLPIHQACAVLDDEERKNEAHKLWPKVKAQRGWLSHRSHHRQ